MGRNKVGEENVRKLQRTGAAGSSYMLTVPKRLIQELGWRERERVIVERVGNTLVVRDWKK